MSAMLVVRRATFSRLGALSGKIIVILNRTANGTSRLVSRETITLATTATKARTGTATQRDGNATWLASTRAKTVPAPTGTPRITKRSRRASPGRARHRPSSGTSAITTTPPHPEPDPRRAGGLLLTSSVAVDNQSRFLSRMDHE